MRTRSISLAVLLASALSFRALGQKMTVGWVAFRNAGSLAQADLESVAAFHAGEKVSIADIQKAAQRLMDTGFFADVTVDSSGPPTEPAIVFVLKPLPPAGMLPVSFENFVWLTSDELRSVVHQAFPLFQNELPEDSNQLDTIATALEAALAAKGVAEPRVSHEQIQPTTARPVRGIGFRVCHPAVVIGTVTLAGVAPLATEEARLEAKLRNAPFAEGDAADATENFLLQPYFDAGFLDAKLAGFDVKLGPAAADRVRVDVAAEVQHGEAYRVSAIQFAGTPLLSQSAFEEGAKLHAGDIASRAQLIATATSIDVAYHRQGYMDEYVDTGVVLDSATHAVSYALKAVPGEQYRLHSVEVQGLPPDAHAQFDIAWKMKPGELYDADYVRTFIVNNTAMQRLTNFVGSFQAAADPATHLVDLTVTFLPTSGAR